MSTAQQPLPPATTPAPPATEPTPAPLNLDNIQGDIVLGLPKKVQEYIFFQICDVPKFRKQILHVLPLITTMAQTVKDYDLINKHKKLTPGQLIKLSGTNIAFSSFGLKKMGITEDLGDAVFAAGQAKDAESLGDPGTGTGATFVPKWDDGFKVNLDGVILVTAESRATLIVRVTEVLALLHSTIDIKDKIFGNVRPGNQKGHEHFGFQDGISQPGIAGFTTKPLPGQDAIDPGFIILGNAPDTRTSKLAKDGSFLAFRKLNQLVPEFNAFLQKEGATEVFQGMTPEEGAAFVGARLVGRWPSGAPIDIATTKDDPELGADPQRNNVFDFDFTNPDDQTDQTRCPFAAHIRKSYPRQDLEKFASIDKNRIIRQGIPFGPEVSEEEKKEKKTLQERGLAFVSYQSNLSNGFSFIQKAWVNTPTFPPKQNPDGTQIRPGFDPLLGQASAASGLHREMIGINPKDQSKQTDLPDFIISRGGEYFFIPSLTALKEVIGSAH